MTDNLENMKKNFNKADEIARELKAVDIENFLDFDNNRRYELAHCETCDGPLLGHIETKCASLNGVKYDGVLIKSIEN